ncbi:MAG: hypothetical protein LBK43_10860 [Treponema sp.]|jgi:hypothetical protein|nr:hypothetical protein [Treponema sp.]
MNEADIRQAFKIPEYDAVFEEGDPSKNLLIGFDCNANPLEILYNVIDENTVQVFHAMRCRAVLISLLKE